MSVEIYFPPDYFESKDIKIDRERIDPVTSKGLFIDYDIIYSDSIKNHYQGYFSSFFRLNIFFDKGSFISEHLLSYSDLNKKFVRLNTKLILEDLDNIRVLEIGDITSSNILLDTSLRLGGIKISTDYSMRPDIIKYPLPDFSGNAELPSTVDIYSETSRILSKDLKPGPFEIKDIPVISPDGNLRIVIKDALGRERVVFLPYFTHPSLIKKGLKEYSVSAGFKREKFTIDSFNYTNFIASGFLKYGLTNDVTLNLQSFIDSYDRGNFIFSPYILLNYFGLFAPIVGASYDGKNDGYLLGLEYSKNIGLFNISLSKIVNSDNFYRYKTATGNYKDTTKIYTSFNFPYLGNLSSAYFKRIMLDNQRQEGLSISYNKNIFNKIFISLTYNLNKFSNDADSFSNKYENYKLSISMPLGNNQRVFSDYQKNRDADTYGMGIFKNPTFSQGLGYMISAKKINNNNQLYALLNYNFEHFTLNSEIQSYFNEGNNSHYYRLGVKGSIIYLDGDVFFRRSITNSFAIVKIVPPLRDVVVLSNNSRIGKTDKNGTIFIPNLFPYTKNEIRIDPGSLDIKAHIDKTIYNIVPLKKHGYLLKFRSKKVNSVRLKITFPDGSFPDAGIRFSVNDNSNIGVLGYKGNAFIENITAGKHIVTVDYGYGVCSFELVIKEEWLEKIVPYIGEYICVPQTGTMIVKEDKENLIKPAKLVQNKKEEEKLKKFKKVSYKKPNPKDSNKIDKNINNNAKVNTNTYTIEVGKFDSKEIEKAVEEYEEFQKEVVKEGNIYKIYIGRFKSKEDAKKFMNIFKINGKITVLRKE